MVAKKSKMGQRRNLSKGGHVMVFGRAGRWEAHARNDRWQRWLRAGAVDSADSAGQRSTAPESGWAKRLKRCGRIADTIGRGGRLCSSSMLYMLYVLIIANWIHHIAYYILYVQSILCILRITALAEKGLLKMYITSPPIFFQNREEFGTNLGNTGLIQKECWKDGMWNAFF